MQEGKRRSLRSQAAPPGAAAVNGMVGGVAEHSGVCRVLGLESLHSLSSRSSTASPTPTVGTAIGSHGAASPASEVVAPQQRLRRPMNSFLLYSNDHRPKIAMANPELTNAAVSVLLGVNWKALPANERAVYVEAAKKIKENFKAEHPEYRYARSTRTKGKKRKGGLNAEQADDSSSAPPEALSLHALALAGASLASPPSGPSPPPGSFKTCSFRHGFPQSSPAPGPRATVQRPAVSPVSSELSMLDQLCVVADGVPRG